MIKIASFFIGLIIYSHGHAAAIGEPLPIQVRYTQWLQRIPATLTKTEYISIIVISEQRHYLFHNDQLHSIYPVSTGSTTRYKGNRQLKEAVWRLGVKMDSGLRPIYGARLIYMEKFNPKAGVFKKTQLAFHGTNEPHNIGSPTSMGCVYHYDRDIMVLYDALPTHTLVISVQK